MRDQRLTRTVLTAFLGLVLVLAAQPARATNGMYNAGYGSEAAGRGGTNIAIADRALGLHSNPAGIAQLQGNHYSVDMQILMPSLDYRDAAGNDLAGEDNMYFMPSFSYVRGAGDSDWTWGIAMVSQGGMGAEFRGYTTPFGPTPDKTFSEVRFARVIPSFAYSVNESLSLGFAANLGYSDVDFQFWPDTSFYFDPGTPADPSDDMGFFGLNMTEKASTINYSLRAGLMWRIDPRWQLGVVYETKTEGDYEDGKLVLDQSSLGLGDVAYDAKIDGFTWPEQYGVGVEFRPSKNWVMALDAKRYMWNDAVNLIRVQADNPDNPATPITQAEVPFVFNWNDQWVYAVGAERRLDSDVTLRFGYNYGESAVPDDTLNPLFPGTVEAHATVGVGWNTGSSTWNFSLERGFENTQTNNNLDPMVNPFGPGATVDHSQWTVSFGYSKAFSRR